MARRHRWYTVSAPGTTAASLWQRRNRHVHGLGVRAHPPPLRDPRCVPDRLGPLVEGGEHLVRGLHVELVGLKAQPVRIGHRLAGLQAQQNVMDLGVGLF